MIPYGYENLRSNPILYNDYVNVVNTTTPHGDVMEHGIPFSVLIVLLEGNSLTTSGFTLEMVSNVWNFDVFLSLT